MNDLGMDSLDHVEVIMAMEDEFGEYFNAVFPPIVRMIYDFEYNLIAAISPFQSHAHRI